jgi:hypothetical protein
MESCSFHGVVTYALYALPCRVSAGVRPCGCWGDENNDEGVFRMTTNQRSYAKIAAVLMSTCAYTALAQAQTFAPSVPAAAPQQVAQAQSSNPDQVAQARPAPQQQQAVIEEIIVEGQRIKETALSNVAVDFARYGTQVQVISNYEIDTGGFTNFGELASGLIRGANIGYSPDEGEFTIRIDGGSDRDTLLLLDGVPTFDRGTPLEDLWGATAIDPRMIDSVEIFRGGQSLYYGGNGGLGVVSVRYKQPDGSEKANSVHTLARGKPAKSTAISPLSSTAKATIASCFMAARTRPTPMKFSTKALTTIRYWNWAVSTNSLTATTWSAQSTYGSWHLALTSAWAWKPRRLTSVTRFQTITSLTRTIRTTPKCSAA